jgi:hypothetical protein
VDDVSLVADSTPDADHTDILAVFRAAEMVVPPLKHPLATAGPAKEQDAFFAGNVDHHFVHRKGPPFAKKLENNTAPPLRSGLARGRPVGIAILGSAAA